MNKNVEKDIETITKEQFLKYLVQRKNIDKTFGKTIVEKFEKHSQVYEKQKAHQRDRYAINSQNAEFVEKRRKKGREAYLKAKEKNGKNRFLETPSPEEMEMEMEPEMEPEIEKPKLSRVNAKINTLF